MSSDMNSNMPSTPQGFNTPQTEIVVVKQEGPNLGGDTQETINLGTDQGQTSTENTPSGQQSPFSKPKNDNNDDKQETIEIEIKNGDKKIDIEDLDNMVISEDEDDKDKKEDEKEVEKKIILTEREEDPKESSIELKKQDTIELTEDFNPKEDTISKKRIQESTINQSNINQSSFPNFSIMNTKKKLKKGKKKSDKPDNTVYYPNNKISMVQSFVPGSKNAPFGMKDNIQGFDSNSNIESSILIKESVMGTGVRSAKFAEQVKPYESSTNYTFDFDKYQRDMTSLHNEVLTYKNSISELRSAFERQVLKLQTELGKEKTAALKANSMTRLAAKKTASQLSALGLELEAVKKQLNEKENSVNTMDLALNVKQEELGAKDKEIADLQKQLSELKSELGDRNIEVDSLKKDVEILTKEVGTLKKDNESKDNEILRLGSDKDDLAKDLEDYKKKVEEYEEKFRGKELLSISTINGMKSDINTKGQENTQLKEENENLSKEVAKLTQQLNNLQVEIETYKQSGPLVKDLNNKLAVLDTSSKEKDKKLADYEAENLNMKKNLEVLNKDYAELVEKNTELELLLQEAQAKINGTNNA